MNTHLHTPAPEVARDRYGRPLIIPKGGGKPTAYTRCTTYIDVLEDKYNLQKWMQRQVALGLSQRPDLLTSVIAHHDNKRELDSICEKAREAAGSSSAATNGTSVHSFTEVLDRGGDIPAHLPAPVKASLDAYAAATAPLKAAHIEQFTVLDTLKIGGTPDRIVKVDGDLVIADIKTGSIEWGALKIAMQMAIYARSWLYDPATGARTAHGADLTKALIIHLPAVDDPADAKCELHWIDIEAGWQAVRVATDVREQRRIKFTDLTTPFGQPHLSMRQAAKADRVAAQAAKADNSLPAQIRRCKSADDVRALWNAHQDEWTDDLTAVATAHINSLPTVA